MADIGLFVVEIQLFHLVLTALVHVDGEFVQQHGHGEAIHFADHAVILRIRNVDDDEVLVAG